MVMEQTTKEYRVQEYVLDMGAFYKQSILILPPYEYHHTNRTSLSSRLIILPSNDPQGKKLPMMVQSGDGMAMMIQEYELLELRRCREEGYRDTR